MKGAFKKRDWIANGALFPLYHLHQPWSMPSALIEGICLEAYPSRRFQSAWMGIIVHSLPERLLYHRRPCLRAEVTRALSLRGRNHVSRSLSLPGWAHGDLLRTLYPQ